MVDIVKFGDEFFGFIIMEVKEFNDYFEECGIKVVVVVVVVGLVGGGDVGGVVVEDKDEFDVILKDGGVKKINVIKVVCEVVFGFGLKEVKEFVEGVFKLIKEGVLKDEVEEIKKKFEEVGVIVEFK